MLMIVAVRLIGAAQNRSGWTEVQLSDGSSRILAPMSIIAAIKAINLPVAPALAEALRG